MANKVNLASAFWNWTNAGNSSRRIARVPLGVPHARLESSKPGEVVSATEWTAGFWLAAFFVRIESGVAVL